MFVSPYEILGVEKFCSDKQLQKTYNKLLKKTQGTPQNKLVQQAYDEIRFIRNSENSISTPFRGSNSLRLFDNSSFFEPFEPFESFESFKKSFSNVFTSNFSLISEKSSWYIVKNMRFGVHYV